MTDEKAQGAPARETVRLTDGVKRGTDAIKCPKCGGYAEEVDATPDEDTEFGCGRYLCCSAAFVCGVCGTRIIGRFEAPENGVLKMTDQTSAPASEATQIAEFTPPTRSQLPSIDDSQAVLMTVQRISFDPTISPEKMRPLLDMQWEILRRNAERAFTRAMTRLQPRLPTIDRKGTIIIRNKEDRQKGLPEEQQRIVQTTRYAKWEDIWEAVKGPLGEEGFALTFSSDETKEGKISVTAYLKHFEGHKETTTLVLQHESSGSKNPVQAIGSTLSYAKRYTSGLLLNYVSQDIEADDDGEKGGGPALIGDDQLATLEKLLADTKTDRAVFLGFYTPKGAAPLADLASLPAAKFDHAKTTLERKAAQQQKAAAEKTGDAK